MALLGLSVLGTRLGAQEGSPVRMLTDVDLSPDGKTLYFSHQGHLWAVPSLGGKARQLTQSFADDVFPRVSPDGQWIAFQGNMEGNYELYVMPATGGEPRRITTTDADENLVDWTPDGALYYTTAEGDTNLWYMDVESALP